MIARFVRSIVVAVAVCAMYFAAVDVNASCCGGGATTAYYSGGYSSYYAPQTYSSYYAGSYSAYYPQTYQTYSSGWYPGYYWDRARARLWGSPTTYVASYPTTYAASYAPSYSYYAPTAAVSYAAPACSSCSTCSTCTAGYAPSCSTCTQQVTMRPVCGCPSACSTCDTCSTCSTCGVSGVTQTSYQESTCPTCNANRQTTVVTEQSQRTPDVATQHTFDNSSNTNTGSNGAPNIDPGASVPLQREEQRPITNGDTQETPAEQETQPGPGEDSTEFDPYKTDSTDGSTYLQPPQLFSPHDRAAQRSIAPVTTALYQKPVSYRSVSASSRPITAQEAERDAIGWTSVSK